MATVAVIGASGFVGTAIVDVLASSGSFRPIACMRHSSPAIACETRLCDAAEAGALERVLGGVDYAVNCVLGDARTMIAATRNLCEVACKLRFKRLVHISSMAVYGAATGMVAEEQPMSPDSPYAWAKADCERIVDSFQSGGGNTVILRPGCVYGPGGQQWVGRIARWLRAGRLGDLGLAGEGICNLTYHLDLARAALAALDAADVCGRKLNISHTAPKTWNAYFHSLGEQLEVSLKRISSLRLHIETGLLAPPLQVAKLAGRRCGLPSDATPEPIPLSLARLWRQPMTLDCSAAERHLPFQRTSADEGIAASAAWFRDR